MKTYFFLFLFLTAQWSFAQTDSLTKIEIEKDVESLSLLNANDTANYIVGMIFSKQLETLPDVITVDDMIMLKGFLAAQQKEAIFTFEDANKLLMEMIAPPPPADTTVEEEIVEADAEPAQPKAKMTPDEMVFFLRNGKREEVTTLPSGIQYELTLGNGRGASPKADDEINVFFFSEYKAENGETIKAENKKYINISYENVQWQEVFQLLKVGNTYRFYLPSSYNQRAVTKLANKDKMIIVDIELINIEEPYSYDDDDDY